ncbi:MAG: acetyl-CoA carboxylase biotin carboxylase subunit [Gaiellaceae bacterium]
MFSRVLVANRGEIAVRVIRGLHELGIEAVAVYSTADEGSLHVKLADSAVCIGPPASTESYLKIPNLIAAAETTGCQAVHPGYGFLSENPDFVEACEQSGLVFIGPSADLMRRMGDKAEAKRELAMADVPLVPGSDSVAGIDGLREVAERLGYPLLLKAAAGGGGKGMRWVSGPEELEEAFSAAGAEAGSAFGDSSLYIERAIVPARHIEIQVLCDHFGNVLTLGERECSIQRRHQKLIEESPSPALTSETRAEMEATVERACSIIGYRNAGTFEFLLGPDGSFYFMELNARIQVEHPVTELVMGIDIVHEQVRIAAGERLSRVRRMQPRGHAIELRVNSEDPFRDFAPSPGELVRFRVPQGPGIRIDSHAEEGMQITPFYDSLLAKLVVWDTDRDAAIRRALRALDEFEIAGVATTIPLLREALASDAFRSGRYSTSFLSDGFESRVLARP